MSKKGEAFSHNPFAQQAHLLPKRKKKKKRPSVPKPPPLARAPKVPTSALSDEELLAKAMSDVVPLDGRHEKHAAEAPKEFPVFPVANEDEEVRRALEALVTGGGDFDLYYSDEYVEGSQQGIDPAIVERLRDGDYAWQGYLDLHGMRVEEAKEAIGTFIEEHRRRGHRCLLLVHGRGRHSPEQIPVLKQRLVNWLMRGFLRKQILAFATARNHDGGAGALYILLA